MSPSMNQVVPVQVFATSLRAVWHPRRGRKPWERPENWVLICLQEEAHHLAHGLSVQVGSPSGLLFPFFFGM